MAKFSSYLCLLLLLFCFTCLFETGTRTAHINHELTMTPRMTLNSLSFAFTSKVLKSQRPAPLPPSSPKVFINFYSKPLGTHFSNTRESMRQDGFFRSLIDLFGPAASGQDCCVQLSKDQHNKQGYCTRLNKAGS